MARLLATKELVFDAASSLVSDGTEPTIVNVQAKIGGGSYTTIKRYLDAWNVQREISAQEALETPSFVLEKSAELGRQLWAMALRDANKQTQSVRDAAVGKVTAIARDLEFAHSEIRRMEELEESQNQLLENINEQLSKVTEALTDAQIKASKVPDLEARLAAALAEAATARQAATDKAVEIGRMTGETEALRKQLVDLTSALVSPSNRA